MVHFLGSELGKVKMQATPLLRMTEALEKSLEDLQPIQSFFKFIFFWKENFSRREDCSLSLERKLPILRGHAAL